MKTADYLDRNGPIDLSWSSDLWGRLCIAGARWCYVEWSERRQEWCIEDSQGRCLRHAEDLVGTADSKQGAIELATAMIRDGRMPSRPEAEARRQAERQRRRQRPTEQRRRAERAAEENEYMRVSDACWDARIKEKTSLSLYETLADAFDFADPELWKSNSFSTLRPALIAHVQLAIVKLEYELHWEARSLRRQRAKVRAAILAKRQGNPTENEQRLARARAILALLEGEPQVQSQSAE